jgi:hypothetical protein
LERQVPSDNFVCGACFGNQGLRDFCSQRAEHYEQLECDFCGATANEPIAIPVDEVIEHINSCVHRYFDDPGNAGLPYVSAEGGWQGPTYETYEVFQELGGPDLPRDSDGRLFDAIVCGLDTDLWCEVEPYRLSPDEALRFSWEQFCQVIKHERRYFFLQTEEGNSRPEEDTDLYSPAETLRALFAFAEQAGAFSVLAVGARLYRARHQPPGTSYKTAGELGPPPLDHAIQTNRMSPPGIVMTYAADDCETALAETAEEPGAFAIGQFGNCRDLLILDLTRVPDAPCPFAELPDNLDYDPRPHLNFLQNISREISRPIARDDRVHIEYVPTQVITEYLRTAVRIDGRRVDGIRYSSSRCHGATAVVLFADQSNLVLEERDRPKSYITDDRWLGLEEASSAEVTDEDIARWRAS